MSTPAWDPFEEDDAEDEGEGLLAKPQTCRVCGCTRSDACIGEDGEPCHWVTDDLCSACLEV